MPRGSSPSPGQPPQGPGARQLEDLRRWRAPGRDLSLTAAARRFAAELARTQRQERSLAAITPQTPAAQSAAKRPRGKKKTPGGAPHGGKVGEGRTTLDLPDLPAALRGKVTIGRLARGTLTLSAPDAPSLFELDRFLRTGGAERIRALVPGVLRVRARCAGSSDA